MRKVLVSVLLLGFALILAACGKSQVVQNVEQLIAVLPAISMGNEAPILEAENAYGALSDEEKEQVEGYSILTEARASFDLWKADKEKADEVDGLISQIGQVALESLGAITKARSAYDALSTAQKEMVGNYAILTTAEEEYPELQIETVIGLIERIGAVTITSEKQIHEAESAYNSLDASLKEQVNNYPVLGSARETLSQLKVSNAEVLISAIGSVTLSSESAIVSAEKAYSALSADEAKRVSNRSILTDSRNTYDALAAEEAMKLAIAEARSIIRVTRIWVSRPDSAGGVKLYFNFVNNSEKAIKYVTFGATFYNAVGDVATCKYKRDTVNYCSDTGPYEKGKGISGTKWYWGKFYNWDISSVKLISLNIEYMDGTMVWFTPEQIEYIQY
ncbi:MAG: hypothetical protein FWF10_00785 [Clostridiales bacterium]|nr:hypothetical protein [Clostridiales bacterium]